jgi:hypothetical protein
MTKNIESLLEQAGGIQLDIASGANKQPGFVGIDIQDLPGVDIVWDLNVHPWPLPDACALRAIASHILEHIPKVVIDNGRTRFPLIEFMNEVWRLLKPGSQFAISAPHGSSMGFMQDPTHSSMLCEASFAYFDPSHPFYNFYRPKPWKIASITWNPAANIEVLLTKLEETPHD